MDLVCGRGRRGLPARLTRWVLLSLLLASVSSCRASPWRRDLLFSQAGTAIYRETKHDEEGNQVPLGYAHPVQVPPEHLQTLLGELKYTRKRWLLGDQSGAVFTLKELERLVVPLSAALGEMGPDERLRFLTSRYVWSVLMPSHVGNSGVIFATAPDRLHIAFDLVEDALPDEDGDARRQRFDTEPTEITGDKRTVLPPEGIEHHQDAGTGTSYPCWLVVNPANIAAISARVEGARAGSPPRARRLPGIQHHRVRRRVLRPGAERGLLRHRSCPGRRLPEPDSGENRRGGDQGDRPHPGAAGADIGNAAPGRAGLPGIQHHRVRRRGLRPCPGRGRFLDREGPQQRLPALRLSEEPGGSEAPDRPHAR